MLNPNFLLAHRNRYSEGMDDGQKPPRGYPNFNSYVKNLRDLVFWTDRQTDRQTDGWTETLIRCGLPSLKLGCLNGHALCTYFIGIYGRSFNHSTMLCFRRWTNHKLPQGLLRLQVTRAPPWYFPPINQSCLSPRLWPHITNPLKVKPPLSI